MGLVTQAGIYGGRNKFVAHSEANARCDHSPRASSLTCCHVSLMTHEAATDDQNGKKNFNSRYTLKKVYTS